MGMLQTTRRQYGRRICRPFQVDETRRQRNDGRNIKISTGYEITLVCGDFFPVIFYLRQAPEAKFVFKEMTAAFLRDANQRRFNRRRTIPRDAETGTFCTKPPF